LCDWAPPFSTPPRYRTAIRHEIRMHKSTSTRENAPQDAQRQAGTVPFPVPLNHWFIVPDTATYKAIATSEFLQTRFAVTETRTTVRGDASYTGVYLYGTHTYCEFLDTSNDTRIGQGDSGVAFGVEQTAGLEAIARIVPREFQADPSLVTREYDGHAVPWFSMATPQSVPYADPSGFSFWLMEYHPRFLVEWRRSSTGLQQGITRADVLQRYAATRPVKPAAPLFEDVTGLTVALDETHMSAWVDLCKVFGYRVSVSSRETVLHGPDLTLKLIVATDGVRGVREITMRLRSMAPRAQEYQLGSTVLTLLRDGTGTWRF
jgi:hypothetical protein